jgi:hypothetical protein
VIWKILAVALLLPALVACRTTKERQQVEAMQMPPKPEGTARIVLYRTDAVTDARAPAPVVAVNGETVGELPDDSLIIRDVAPGELEVTLALPEASKRDKYTIRTGLLRATLNAGGEWFVETVVAEPCKRGTRLVDPHPSNLSLDIVPPILRLTSMTLEAATTECGGLYDLNPAWPKSTWNLNPLLKKYGAEPARHEPLPDIHLPQSNLHWHVAERAIRSHFEGNGAAYIPYLDPSGRDNLLLKEITLIREVLNTDGNIGILVNVEYLHVSHETIAGRYVKRPLRYSLHREGESVTVVSWTDPN